MPYCVVEGRVVFHRLGTKTQTINICTSENIEGTYAERYGMPISVEVPLVELAAQPDLAALRTWLISHGAEPLPTDTAARVRMPALVGAAHADDAWVAQARSAVERALTEEVDRFLDQPLLHRVEHSLHAQLWSRLKREPLFQEEVALRGGGYMTQLVHKEWPETVARRRADGKPRPRGLFDLAILSPEQVRLADPEQFAFGRIEAPIVIEVGLDYGEGHLREDCHKLVNSRVPAGYLLHLSRLTDSKQEETEQLICRPPEGIRTAYAHVDLLRKRSRSKRVQEDDVRTGGASPA